MSVPDEQGSALDIDTVVAKPMTARARRMRGQVIVANGTEAYELDEVSAFIFARVNGRNTVAVIGAAVAEAYEVPVAEATQDTLDLLRELAGLGLVTPADAG